MNNNYYRIVKRVFDATSATVLLTVISPLYIVLMIKTKKELGTPIFFCQVRSGMGQKPFIIKKFRTMTDEKTSDGTLLPDEKRITKFGSFMRSTSLDEIPELVSIIKGDMSVIGPRPLPVEYDGYYRENERKRFLVRGGLIPPDSLYGGMDLSWDYQLQCEADYAENLSFRNDCKVFLAVFKTLLKRKNGHYGNIVRKSLIEERRKEQH